MPAMSPTHSLVCRSAPWRAFASRVVLPWALQGASPRGEVLEIGAGSGAMAAAFLGLRTGVTLTAIDVDDDMVRVASARLAKFGARARVRTADATALAFPDNHFDAVLSWVMLHHTIEWEAVLAEALRVLRPGGQLIGYDLLDAGLLRARYKNDPHVRLVGRAELRAELRRLPVDQAILTPSLFGTMLRFNLQKR